MKRALLIFVVGLFAALTTYCALYYCGTREQRKLLQADAPELAWLKSEFHLSDAEFGRVSKLHEGYMPRCAELCHRIAAKKSELRELMSGSPVDANAVEQKLKEAGELRIECQKNMFNHFLEVSRQMPPEQGRRYLQWVQERTLMPENGMAEDHSAAHGGEHR